MPQNVSTPSHCPGFEGLRNLSAFTCKCPECGNAMSSVEENGAREDISKRIGEIKKFLE